MNRDHPGVGMIHAMGDTQAAIFLLLAVGLGKHSKIQPIPRAVLRFLFKKYQALSISLDQSCEGYEVIFQKKENGLCGLSLHSVLMYI